MEYQNIAFDFLSKLCSLSNKDLENIVQDKKIEIPDKSISILEKLCSLSLKKNELQMRINLCSIFS